MIQKMSNGNKKNENINPYQGCYNFGKNNVLRYQGICPQCKIKKMERYLDYDQTKKICKCEGYGCL